jgi:hypothetical protein
VIAVPTRVRRFLLLAVVAVLGGVIVVVGVLTRLGGDSAASDESGLAAVAVALCDATEQAGQDPAAARATFLDRAHEGVHTIARQLQEADHADTASRLLEAKFQVESDLDTDPPAPQLQEHLAALTGAVNEGLRQLNGEAGCTPEPAA